MNHSSVTAVVLAAGKGTRLKSNSEKNKVVLKLADKPMISYAVDNLRLADIKDILVVIGFASQSVKATLGDSVNYVTQTDMLGTGDALKTAFPVIDPQSDTIISLYGDDSAFYSPDLYHHLIASHHQTDADVSVLTLTKANPSGLGRIIRNSEGQLQAIVEEKNATTSQKQIQEINAGLYCFKRSFLEFALPLIKRNPLSQEYYLTDVISIAIKHQMKAQAINWETEDIWYGINTKDQLEKADTLMRQQVD